MILNNSRRTVEDSKMKIPFYTSRFFPYANCLALEGLCSVLIHLCLLIKEMHSPKKNNNMFFFFTILFIIFITDKILVLCVRVLAYSPSLYKSFRMVSKRSLSLLYN